MFRSLAACNGAEAERVQCWVWGRVGPGPSRSALLHRSRPAVRPTWPRLARHAPRHVTGGRQTLHNQCTTLQRLHRCLQAAAFAAAFREAARSISQSSERQCSPSQDILLHGLGPPAFLAFLVLLLSVGARKAECGHEFGFCWF